MTWLYVYGELLKKVHRLSVVWPIENEDDYMRASGKLSRIRKKVKIYGCRYMLNQLDQLKNGLLEEHIERDYSDEACHYYCYEED